MIAQHGTASHLEQVVRKYRNVKCTNEDKAECEQELDRELEEEKEEDVSAETLLTVDVLQQRDVATHDQIMDLYQLTWQYYAAISAAICDTIRK
jgi:hypothetical protein